MRKSILLALASAFSHIESASTAVQFSFAKRAASTHNTATGLARRAPDAGFSYQAAVYVVNVTVGTPGQPLSLQISSSASNTWVVDARSSWCTSETYDYDTDEYIKSSGLCPWGAYSPGNSTSFKSLSSSDDDDSYSSYDDNDSFTSHSNGVYAYGDLISDALSINDVSVTNLTMGLANYSYSYGSTYMGALGIGYNDSTNDNLLDKLLDQELVNSTAYSIWLDDEAGTSGNLLFGAVDTAKVEGNLTRLISEYSYSQMIIRVVEINGTTSESGGVVPIIVTSDEDDDSYGSNGYTSEEYSADYLFTAIYSPTDSVSIFPTDIASQIWQMAGARYDDDLELAVISCSAAVDTETNFTLRLGGRETAGPVISASMSDLVITTGEFNMSAWSYLYDETDTNTCLFGVQNDSLSSINPGFTLGGPVLRRTFSVFDLANSELAVAPVKFDATSTSNVVPFASYGALTPSSTILCTYLSCSEGSGRSSSSSSGDGEEGGSSGSLSGVLPVGALVGMTVGIALFLLLLALAGFLVWRRRLNRDPADKEATSVASAEAGEHPPTMSSANGESGGAAAPLPERTQSPDTTAGGINEPESRPAPSPPSSTGEGHSGPRGDEPGVQSSHGTTDRAEASPSHKP